MIYEQRLNEFLQKPGVYSNQSIAQLIEIALAKGEGCLTQTGAISVATGKYTGRSPNDKFFVRYRTSATPIDWGSINQAMSPDHYNLLFQDVLAYLEEKDVYVFDGFAGADPNSQYAIKVINEYSWQNIFMQNMLLRPTSEELQSFQPDYHIICAPGFKASVSRHATNSEAAVVLNLEEKIILICGTSYAGEIKKAVFTLINYLLPQKGILSMHCSANLGPQKDAALFFGLSGTGKTTLSADPSRQLIGDDEHGWSDQGIFNIEGGCYAKCIGLDPNEEPQIWNAIHFGAVLENVDVDPISRRADFKSGAYTENTRCAYPIDYIPDAVIPAIADHPKAIFFLTADAFGVLPPIAKLSTEQAMVHFLSGYTSKLAGTERGILEPEATFSECFGAPFLPLSPVVYAKLLGEKLNRYGSQVYLVNTGWTGGAYGVGHRFKISHTRAIIKAALEGTLDKAGYRRDPLFGFEIPLACPGLPGEVLDPRSTWPNPMEYDIQAKLLAERFRQNFSKFKKIPDDIQQAVPCMAV